MFPGHEYLLRNLGFTLDAEPSNQAARELAQRVTETWRQRHADVDDGQERQVNVFFRLDQPEIIAGAAGRERPCWPEATREVFLALRELRNRW